MTLVVGVLWFASLFRSVSIGYHTQPHGNAIGLGVSVYGGYVAWIAYGSPSAYEDVGFGVSSFVTWPQDRYDLKYQFVPVVIWDWGTINVVFVPFGPSLLLVATILFLSSALPSALRTAHRRRRNRCVACGYAQDEALERCPECGRLASEPSTGFWLLTWRAYRWPLVCIAVNVAVTLVAIEVMN